MKGLAVAALLAAWTWSGAADAAERVLSIGGAVTEIVYALGEDHRLVGRDTTSTFPMDANALPDVGYMRALAPEGVLSVDPDLIIAIEGAGPPETLEVLQAASIDFVEIPERYDAEGIAAKVRAVGAALGAEDKAEALVAEITAELDAAIGAASANLSDPKRVLFVLSTANERIMASGTNTGADGIIRMAGGVNAIDGFEGYKPLTDEAITLAAPDVILMMDRGGNHGISNEALFAMPSMALTPAAETGSVVRLNGLLMLGFGPRTAEAVGQLNAALYGD